MKASGVRRVEKYDALIVAGLSIVIMLIQTGYRGNAFMADDNATQFYPVIDKVFEGFIKTGRLACYDFFQMKGMLIGDEGYYGQTNPVMFVSWLFSKYVIPYFDGVTMYGIVCVIIGNLGWNCLFRRMGYSFPKRILTITMESTVSAFIWFSYWYFVYSSYIVIPVLLMIMYRILTEEKKSLFFLGGLALFFSLTLGNVQYTFYHYMIFGIILLLGILLSRQYKKLRYLVSNVVVGVLLSAPLLLLQLNAAGRRNAFIDENEFFSYNVSFVSWILNAFIPIRVLLSSEKLKDISQCEMYHQQFMPGIYLCFFAFFVCLVRDKVGKIKGKKVENKTAETVIKDDRYKFVIAVFACMLFFMLYQAGKDGLVAYLLSAIPVVNSFRRLYKLSLVIAPLSVIPAIYILDRFWHKKIVIVLAVLASAIGMADNAQIMKGYGNTLYADRDNLAYISQYDDLADEMEAKGMDLNNYRLLGMCSEENLFAADHFDARFIAGNLPTDIGIYSVGGYETALMLDHYPSVSAIFTDPALNYSISGHASLHTVMGFDGTNVSYDPKLLLQMQQNAIKYCMVRGDINEQYVFKLIVEYEYGEQGVKVIDLSNGYRIYELIDIPRLCNYATLIKKDLSDQLTFRIDEDTTAPYLGIAFSYNDELTAFYTKNGITKVTELFEDQNGNIVIPVSEEMKGAELVIRYGGAADQSLMYYGMLGSLIAIGCIAIIGMRLKS